MFTYPPSIVVFGCFQTAPKASKTYFWAPFPCKPRLVLLIDAGWLCILDSRFLTGVFGGINSVRGKLCEKCRIRISPPPELCEIFCESQRIKRRAKAM